MEFDKKMQEFWSSNHELDKENNFFYDKVKCPKSRIDSLRIQSNFVNSSKKTCDFAMNLTQKYSHSPHKCPTFLNVSSVSHFNGLIMNNGLESKLSLRFVLSEIHPKRQRMWFERLRHCTRLSLCSGRENDFRCNTILCFNVRMVCLCGAHQIKYTRNLKQKCVLHKEKKMVVFLFLFVFNEIEFEMRTNAHPEVR